MAEETMHIETNQQDQLATTCETNNGAESHDNTDISQQICSVDAAAAEAAEAAKAAAAAAAEAARVAEQLAAEAAKVAEAAAAEKLRLEEEAAALKLKEFIDSQSDLFREIHSKVPKVNLQVCVKLEELVSRSFLCIEDVANLKLSEALKDLNENCLNAFDEYIAIKEVAASKTEESSAAASKTEESSAAASEQPATQEMSEPEGGIKNTQDTSYSTTQESNAEIGDANDASQLETTQPMETQPTSDASQQPKPTTTATTATTQPAKVKSDVDVLSGTLFKWKRSNKDKLTQSSAKNQSLLQAKNNRKSIERPGPNPDKLKEILARTGYSHEISSGQRKYGGPPPDWTPSSEQTAESQSGEAEMVTEEGCVVAKAAEATAEVGGEKMDDETSGTAELTSSQKEVASAQKEAALCVPPPQGCECFVGKLPRDLFEDELIPVFEKHGRIWDLRLMIDPSSGFSKGYCFVTYCNKTDAQAAAKALNDFEIRPGKEIRVNISVANIKLFVGNIPRTKSKEELKAEFAKVVEGLTEVVIYNQGETATDDKVKNRGFCFLEFIDHKSASVAKRKLSSPRFNRVFNREVAVDWADPNDEPDEETMSKVKVLYVKNLGAEVTEEEVQKVFEQYGKLERVRKMKDYAFVHFDQREDAVKAMEEQNGKVLGKLPLEISLARPLTDKKKQAQQKRMEINRGGHQGNVNWNNNGGHYINHRQNNNNNFNPNMGGGGRGGNRGQMNNFNKIHNGNRGNFNNGNMMGNGHMNNGMHRGNNRGFMHNNNNNHFNNDNFNNNYNNNNNQRGGMNGRGGGNFRGNPNRGGHNRGGFNNGNQMLHKRKNNDNNFMNGDNNQKKGRFAQNNMNNNNGADFNTNSQMASNNFMGNNGWNQSNFNGMQQASRQ